MISKMKLIRIFLLCAATSTLTTQAAEPLKALLITGGCCHDYAKQKLIISQGISKRANVDWTIMHEGGTGRTHRISIYKKKDWIKDFDVVVHNECFGAIGDKAFVESLATAHRDSGVPAVLLHCTMHSYRAADKLTDEWRKLLGVTTVRHQQHVAVEIENMEPKHPIMQGFGKSWKTPAGELYEIVKVWPHTTVLGQAHGVRTKKDHPCIWVNQYGKARVFGTTIGHHNETMETETYLGYLTRGLLWACDKLDENGKPAQGYGPRK
jgi:type 1 glutamine amidotransferase